MTDEPQKVEQDSTQPTPDSGDNPVPTPEEKPEGSPSGSSLATETEEPKKPIKLDQEVVIRDVGPCRKHIRVTVGRKDIDERIGEHFSKLRTEAMVPGFRPGKVPRKIIERRFHKEVGEDVKREVLLASLEQLNEDYSLSPLSEPEIDPGQLEIPKEGPFTYEFEIEVRPEFDLPDYKKLKLKRMIYDITDEDISMNERRLLADYGQVVPKPEGNAQLGDILIADITTRSDGKVLNTMKETKVEVEKQLAFKDGVAPRFAEQMKGANAGDKRIVELRISNSAAEPSLRGKTIEAEFDIKDIKAVRLPETTPEFMRENYGLDNIDQLREFIRGALGRKIEHQQRQYVRKQVVDAISAASTWELPRGLLAKQARIAMNRRIMEMKADGIPEAEIKSRLRLLEQDVLKNTEFALKEHFVLQKIAEVEEIKIEDADIDEEIERLAAQSDESPRRVRARLEKEDMLDALYVEMLERRALDLVLENAEYEDTNVKEEAEDDSAVATVETQAIPGEMQDISDLEAEAATEKEASSES